MIDRMGVSEIEGSADRLYAESEETSVPRRVATATIRDPEQEARKHAGIPFDDDSLALCVIREAGHAIVSGHQEELLGVERERQRRE